MKDWTDDFLIELLKSGDDMQVKKVYGFFRESFISFIISYFRCDPDRAKDIYPEAFSKLYFNLRDGKLVPPLQCSLKTYLYAVGRRTFQSQYHSTYQKKVFLTEAIPDLEKAAEAVEYYEYQAQASLVKRLLSQISQQCRALLKMIYIEEKDSREVCKLLEIEKLGTLRKRKYDCLQKLRQKLNDDKTHKSDLL